jgi:hypothetical protein
MTFYKMFLAYFYKLSRIAYVNRFKPIWKCLYISTYMISTYVISAWLSCFFRSGLNLYATFENRLKGFWWSKTWQLATSSLRSLLDAYRVIFETFLSKGMIFFIIIRYKLCSRSLCHCLWLWQCYDPSSIVIALMNARKLYHLWYMLLQGFLIFLNYANWELCLRRNSEILLNLTQVKR